MPSPATVANQTDERQQRRVSLRAQRYDALRVVWRETAIKRVAKCRRVVARDAHGVAVKVSPDGAAGFSGVQMCGSVWACPVCSEKINAVRQQELEAAIVTWLALGRGVLFGTLTMRHNRGQRLAELLDAIAPAWNRTTSGSSGWNGTKPKKDGTQTDIGDKRRFGIAGYVRLLEVKHGDSGWHPHIHFLLFTDRPVSPSSRAYGPQVAERELMHPREMLDLQGRLYGRWEAALGRAGYSVVERHGIDLRPVSNAAAIADYFAKGTYQASPGRAAYELAGSQSKQLGKGGRTPFQILAGMVAGINVRTGELVDQAEDADPVRDRALWQEWEKASHGRRQMTWSRGLRSELAELGAVAEVEKTDEEIAEEAPEDGTIAVLISADDWRTFKFWRCLVELLEAAESGTAREFVDARRHRWTVARDPQAA